MKKFYVTGMVQVTRVGEVSGTRHKWSGNFDRVVYADDAVSARDMVFESVKAKWTAGNKTYHVEDFEVVSMEVFESVMVERGKS